MKRQIKKTRSSKKSLPKLPSMCLQKKFVHAFVFSTQCTPSLNALCDYVDGLKVHSCVSVLWKLAPGVGIFNLPVELTNCKRKNHDLQHPLKAMFWKACIKLQFSLPLEHRYYTTGVVCSYNYSTVVRRHNSDSVLVLLAYMQE